MNSNMHSNDAARSLPEGFDSHYQQHMAPGLLKLEQTRKKTARAVLALGALAILGVVPLALGMFGMDIPGVLFAAGMFALFAGILGAAWLNHRFTGTLKQALVKPVCQFLGYDYEARPASFAVDRFVAAGIVPHRFDRSKLEDRISGKHKGVAFELCKVRLIDKKQEKENENKTATVFSGLMLQYTFAKPFAGETCILPNAPLVGIFQRMGLKTLPGSERVILEDPRFERVFQTYATEPAAARHLLAPRFTERLIELATYFSEQPKLKEQPGIDELPLIHQLRLAFCGKHLLIAAPTTEDRFQGGGLFKSVLARERVTQLMHELALVGDIVEVLELEQTSHT